MEEFPLEGLFHGIPPRGLPEDMTQWPDSVFLTWLKVTRLERLGIKDCGGTHFKKNGVLQHEEIDWSDVEMEPRECESCEKMFKPEGPGQWRRTKCYVCSPRQAPQGKAKKKVAQGRARQLIHGDTPRPEEEPYRDEDEITGMTKATPEAVVIPESELEQEVLKVILRTAAGRLRSLADKLEESAE